MQLLITKMLILFEGQAIDCYRIVGEKAVDSFFDISI